MWSDSYMAMLTESGVRDLDIVRYRDNADFTSPVPQRLAPVPYAVHPYTSDGTDGFPSTFLHDHDPRP